MIGVGDRVVIEVPRAPGQTPLVLRGTVTVCQRSADPGGEPEYDLHVQEDDFGLIRWKQWTDGGTVMSEREYDDGKRNTDKPDGV